GAQRLAAADAPAAFAAGQIEISGDLVAHRKIVHAGPERCDLAGNLMAEDARQGRGTAAGAHMLHGEPGPAGNDACYRLTRSRHRIGQGFNAHRRTWFSQNACAHAASSSSPERGGSARAASRGRSITNIQHATSPTRLPAPRGRGHPPPLGWGEEVA